MIIGDKVLCIDSKSIKNKNPYNITENKQYTVIDINKHYIRIALSNRKLYYIRRT